MVAKRVFLLFVILGAGILGKAQCHLSFYGTVTDQDTRGKLGGATIRISETGKTVLSADDGSFRIAGLCPGNYNIVVTHVGCQPLHLHIHLKDDLRKEILLPHAANELSEITIVARLGGNSSGFLDELKGREFNATLGKSLGESLKNINGVNAIQTGSNIYKPVIHGLHSSRVLILNNG
ncbi:MAG TPA: carboxypeptidase-like regulatory domain-containing protein, partial [Parasegetibacter sp.]